MMPILYSYWRSSCSWRVRIALALKGIDYEYRAVHLVKKEQEAESYADQNPMNQVPTLVIDGLIITQSVAIIEYLDEVYPQEPRLLPTDPEKRVIVRSLTEVINSGIQPLQNLTVLQYLGDEKKLDFAHHFIEKGLIGLERMLEKTAGKYCYRDDVTMADCFLVPQVYNANRFGVDMAQFPIISRINETLLQQPAFIAAHASSQPDADINM